MPATSPYSQLNLFSSDPNPVKSARLSRQKKTPRCETCAECFLSDREVAKRYDISRASVWRWLANDPTFPAPVKLKHKVDLAKQIPVLSTTYAVTEAFRVASRGLKVPYTPHAAKHTIGAERDVRQLTHQQRKAWSLNMGHETEQITERHYGTMPEDQRIEVLENIGTDQASDVPQMTDEAKIALVDEVMEKIGLGKLR